MRVASCHPRALAVGQTFPFCGVASDRVYSKCMLPCKWVSSYLAFPSLPCEHGGLFLLHFPGGYPRLTLSAILPYEARTFLTVIPFGDIQRDRSAELSGILYHILGDLSMGEGDFVLPEGGNHLRQPKGRPNYDSKNLMHFGRSPAKRKRFAVEVV